MSTPHPTKGPDPLRYTVLTPRTIWWAAIVIIATGVGMAVWLLLAYGNGDAQQRNQLEAIKTAGTIVVGTGGAAALLLAARRQRTVEIALRQKDRDQAHQEQIAVDTRADAIERRITEIYTSAADQLGSDKAAVRLAGLYALERLAEGNPSHRQTIVNVLCAYLRMPFTTPSTVPRSPIARARRGLVYPPRGFAGNLSEDQAERQQELQVRLTAQRILRDHLCPHVIDGIPTNPKFWTEMDLDLTGATLIDFSMSDTAPGASDYSRATFIGVTSFNRIAFTRGVEFRGATFGEMVSFDSTTFRTHASFNRGTFLGGAIFNEVIFGHAYFTGANFKGKVTFTKARFENDANFESAQFAGGVSLRNTIFEGCGLFDQTEFTGHCEFDGAVFKETARFGEVKFLKNASFDRAIFHQQARFTRAKFSGIASFQNSVFMGDVSLLKTTFVNDSPFQGSLVNRVMKFDPPFPSNRTRPQAPDRHAEALGVELDRITCANPNPDSDMQGGTH